jgi:hypothetical protein
MNDCNDKEEEDKQINQIKMLNDILGNVKFGMNVYALSNPIESIEPINAGALIYSKDGSTTMAKQMNGTLSVEINMPYTKSVISEAMYGARKHSGRIKAEDRSTFYNPSIV